jgi:hypothetical protein
LTTEALKTFREEGLLRQLQLVEPERALALREVLQREVLERPSTAESHKDFLPKMQFENDRHLDSRLVFELCTLPEIIGPITQLIGDNVMLFRSQFFHKQAQAPEIPWHQESHFWNVEKRWVTLWLAVDEVTQSNGLLQLVPGSHDSTREHVQIPVDTGYWSTFKWMANLKHSDQILDCPTAAGEFMLFDDLLHRSLANTTSSPRLAFAARYASPDLVGVHENAYPGHRCLLVSGSADKSPLHFAPPPQNGPGLADVYAAINERPKNQVKARVT